MFLGTIGRRDAIAVCVLALPLFGAATKGTPEPLELGEVTAPGEPGVARVGAFRAIVTDSLSELRLPPLPPGKAFVLSASLVHLKSQQKGSESRANCRVSLIIRTKREGVLRAILSGSAAVSDTARTTSTEDAAMRAAVGSALKRVGPALR